MNEVKDVTQEDFASVAELYTEPADVAAAAVKARARFAAALDAAEPLGDGGSGRRQVRRVLFTGLAVAASTALVLGVGAALRSGEVFVDIADQPTPTATQPEEPTPDAEVTTPPRPVASVPTAPPTGGAVPGTDTNRSGASTAPEPERRPDTKSAPGSAADGAAPAGQGLRPAVASPGSWLGVDNARVRTFPARSVPAPAGFGEGEVWQLKAGQKAPLNVVVEGFQSHAYLSVRFTAVDGGSVWDIQDVRPGDVKSMSAISTENPAHPGAQQMLAVIDAPTPAANNVPTITVERDMRFVVDLLSYARTDGGDEVLDFEYLVDDAATFEVVTSDAQDGGLSCRLKPSGWLECAGVGQRTPDGAPGACQGEGKVVLVAPGGRVTSRCGLPEGNSSPIGMNPITSHGTVFGPAGLVCHVADAVMTCSNRRSARDVIRMSVTEGVATSPEGVTRSLLQ